MNFKPELAAKVMAGEKTATRRLASENPRSPWYDGGCGLKPGRDYAVCPGRGKNAIGRVRVIQVALVRLGELTNDEAKREGFADERAFRRAWAEINGTYDSRDMVWRVDFEVAA